MEDIEDLLAGGAGGAAPGFRLPLNSVGVNPKRNTSKRSISKQDEVTDSNRDSLAPPSMKIPGTQVVLVALSLDLSFIILLRFQLTFYSMVLCRRFTSRRLDVRIIRQVSY